MAYVLYRCDICGATNRSNVDLAGLAHSVTGRRPAPCDGRGVYQPVGLAAPGSDVPIGPLPQGAHHARPRRPRAVPPRPRRR